MPIQPSGASGIGGRIDLFQEHADALKDPHGFSRIILLYHFHRAGGSELIVTPFLDSQPRGVFATRAPKRPNPIGISVVKLLSVEGTILLIENVDILDGTPLIDIKPYVPDFDHHQDIRLGRLEKVEERAREKRSQA